MSIQRTLQTGLMEQFHLLVISRQDFSGLQFLAKSNGMTSSVKVRFHVVFKPAQELFAIVAQ